MESHDASQPASTDRRRGRSQGLPRTNTTIASTVIIGAFALVGCHGAPRATTADPVASPAPPPHPAHDRRVAFAPGTQSDGPSAPRSAAFSVYGERTFQPDGAIGFGDGSSNVSQVTGATDGHAFDPAVDPTGKWLAFASTQHRRTSDIYLQPIGGSTLTQLTNDPAEDMMPCFSPDGKWVAFTSNRAGNFDIYIVPVTGGQPRVITDDPADEVHPSWSPDGKRLVFSRFADQSQRWELWTVEVANPGVRSFLDYGFLPEWSPDPAVNKIVFQRARERGSRLHSIWTIDVIDGQGRNPTEIISAANAALVNPTWSADGRRIVFAAVIDPRQEASSPPAQSELWLVNLDGTGRTALTRGESADFQPVWGPDGRVYFVSNRSGNDNIWAVSTRTAVAGSPPSRESVATVPTNE